MAHDVLVMIGRHYVLAALGFGSFGGGTIYSEWNWIKSLISPPAVREDGGWHTEVMPERDR